MACHPPSIYPSSFLSDLSFNPSFSNLSYFQGLLRQRVLIQDKGKRPASSQVQPQHNSSQFTIRSIAPNSLQASQHTPSPESDVEEESTQPHMEGETFDRDQISREKSALHASPAHSLTHHGRTPSPDSGMSFLSFRSFPMPIHSMR
jgi:hypothetical protein